MLRHTLTALAFTAVSLPAVAEPLNYNVVEFSESAVMEVARDTMTSRFQVRAEGKDRAAVNKEFTRKFNSFNSKSKNSAFQSELLSRSAVPTYQYNKGKRIQTGWIETADFKVESKDFSALNRLIADSQDEASLSHTYFSISKSKREDAIDEVSKAAILRFKDRAKNLAATLGFSNYKIVKLNLGHIGSRQTSDAAAPVAYKMARAVMAEAADMAEPVGESSPGTEEISITVDGSIQM